MSCSSLCVEVYFNCSGYAILFLAKVERKKRVPDYVNDLWESIGTLSARITDLQHVMDDVVGTKKVARARANSGGVKG